MFDATTPAFTHVFIPAELFGVLQSYLGARPAAETGRLLVALENCPTGFINAPSPVEVELAEGDSVLNPRAEVVADEDRDIDTND